LNFGLKFEGQKRSIIHYHLRQKTVILQPNRTSIMTEFLYPEVMSKPLSCIYTASYTYAISLGQTYSESIEECLFIQSLMRIKPIAVTITVEGTPNLRCLQKVRL